ncbi:DoxX family protein [Ketobacter sp.]|uniref:HvfX family Cu-binding RiPP maturation protein n=1 Tax=Ketobacter sp. TaxID=2083498 RepID=UPI000F1222C7|nr:DoxX family protein [Ketobacter sp.]RLT99323.1 MAG: DoxX family protein [Ketobacter sp.]
MIAVLNKLHNLLDAGRKLDFLAPLALRLYLAPIFIAVGLHKMNHFGDIVAWFEHSLGLPFPQAMAFLATAAELLGGVALLLGIAVRWASIPLLVTMLVAMFTAHWQNGWFAVAPSDPATSVASVLAPVGFPGAAESLQNSVEVGKRLDRARDILRENGNYAWLTEKGSFVILNNGIEFAATYFVMLLTLLFIGGGSYLSVDYWIARKFREPDSR